MLIENHIAAKLGQTIELTGGQSRLFWRSRKSKRHDMRLTTRMLANFAKQAAFNCQANPQLLHKTEILLRDLNERTRTITFQLE